MRNFLKVWLYWGLLQQVSGCQSGLSEHRLTSVKEEQIQTENLSTYEPAAVCAAETVTPGLSGCMFIPEDPNNPNSTIIQIYYERFSPADSKKKNLLVLNGGPGGSYKVLFNNPLIGALAKHYNVIFYDQRGIGKSSALDENQPNLQDKVGLYSTNQNVADLLALIDYLQLRDEQGKVNILGHSYGAILAWALAVMNPETVDRLMIWHGATDFQAGLIQTVTKLLFIAHKIASSISGNPDAPIEGPLGYHSDEQITFGKDPRGPKSFASQGIRIPKPLSLSELENLDTSRTYYNMDKVSTLNRAVNNLITCHEFVSLNAMRLFRSLDEFGFETKHYDAIEGLFNMMHGESCQGVYIPAADQPFRVTEDLGHLKMPIFMIGAHKDHLVSMLAVRRDYLQIRKTNPKVLYLELHKADHYPEAQADCVLPYLQKFASSPDTDPSLYGEFHCK